MRFLLLDNVLFLPHFFPIIPGWNQRLLYPPPRSCVHVSCSTIFFVGVHASRRSCLFA